MIALDGPPSRHFSEELKLDEGGGKEGTSAPAVEEGEGGEQQQEEGLPNLADFTEDQAAAVVRIQAAGRGMLDRKKVRNPEP